MEKWFEHKYFESIYYKKPPKNIFRVLNMFCGAVAVGCMVIAIIFYLLTFSDHEELVYYYFQVFSAALFISTFLWLIYFLVDTYAFPVRLAPERQLLLYRSLVFCEMDQPKRLEKIVYPGINSTPTQKDRADENHKKRKNVRRIVKITDISAFIIFLVEEIIKGVLDKKESTVDIVCQLRENNCNPLNMLKIFLAVLLIVIAIFMAYAFIYITTEIPGQHLFQSDLKDIYDLICSGADPERIYTNMIEEDETKDITSENIPQENEPEDINPYDIALKKYKVLYRQNGKGIFDLIFFVLDCGLFASFMYIVYVKTVLHDSKVICPAGTLFLCVLVALFIVSWIAGKIFQKNACFKKRRKNLTRELDEMRVKSSASVKELLLDKYIYDDGLLEETWNSPKILKPFFNILMFFFGTAIVETIQFILNSIFHVEGNQTTDYLIFISLIIYLVFYGIPQLWKTLYGNAHIENCFRSDLLKIMRQKEEEEKKNEASDKNQKGK